MCLERSSGLRIGFTETVLLTLSPRSRLIALVQVSGAVFKLLCPTEVESCVPC